MLHRRKFFLASASLVGLAVINPFFSISALANDDTTSLLTKNKFFALMKKWIALYDANGGYITEVKLITLFEGSSDAQLEQFSLRWEIRDGFVLNPGTYVLEDFSNTQTPIYLDPSFSKRHNGKYYRASFSLLRY